MNKIIYFSIVAFLVLQLGVFGLDDNFKQTYGVTYYEYGDEITRIAAETTQRVFTNHFEVDLSPHIIKIDAGKVDFTIGAEKPQWKLTKHAVLDDSTFQDWFKDIQRTGNLDRRDITISLKDQVGNTVRTMACFDAIPTSWDYGSVDATNLSILTETLVVRCDRVELS